MTDYNDHVKVLTDLTFSSTFGKPGNGKGQFSSPCGRVYVADYSNNRIQVFTAEGRFLRMFGRRGEN